jgi:hypothetical protein
MNDQERQIIAGIFERLEQSAGQNRDPEADRFIAEKIQRQPYAPYAMAQTIYVQEQALTNLHTRNQELEAEMERLRSQPAQGQGGFLSGMFGSLSQPRGTEGPEPRDAPVGGPWGSRPGMAGAGGGGPWGAARDGAQPLQGRGGSGFLGTAMATAAGVAGGMVLGSALASAFGGDKAAGGETAASGGAEASPASALDADSSGFGSGGGIHDASADGADDFGGFDDGGDDWA